MRYRRNDTTTISTGVGDTIVAHRHRDGVRLPIGTTLELDAHGAMRLAATLIAGVHEQTFTIALLGEG